LLFDAQGNIENDVVAGRLGIDDLQLPRKRDTLIVKPDEDLSSRLDLDPLDQIPLQSVLIQLTGELSSNVSIQFGE
jgi:hypothetical protein